MEGYSKVATLMSTYPEFAILRSFRTLNMQNLLYLQAEITHLEEDLRQQIADDIASGKRPDQRYDWWSLTEGHEEGDAKQWAIVLEIREKLEKYNDALLRQSSIFNLDRPTKHNLHTLRDWFERPQMGSFPLYGLDRDSWDKQHEQDLLGLHTQTPLDPLSRFLSDSIMPSVHHILPTSLKRPVPKQLGTGLYEYSDSVLSALVRITTTVIASIFPLCSVVILYVVRSNAIRLGVIVILSTFFTLALSLMTKARNIEIFAVTSAFAAINVVYLTNGAPGVLEN